MTRSRPTRVRRKLTADRPIEERELLRNLAGHVNQLARMPLGVEMKRPLATQHLVTAVRDPGQEEHVLVADTQRRISVVLDRERLTVDFERPSFAADDDLVAGSHRDAIADVEDLVDVGGILRFNHHFSCRLVDPLGSHGNQGDAVGRRNQVAQAHRRVVSDEIWETDPCRLASEIRRTACVPAESVASNTAVTTRRPLVG